MKQNDIKSFLKNVKTKMTCSNDLKHIFINDFREQLESFITENPCYTIKDIEHHFGTPKEIAYSFENHNDLAYYNSLAKKYKRTKIITLTMIILLIFVFTCLVIIVETETEGVNWGWFIGKGYK